MKLTATEAANLLVNKAKQERDDIASYLLQLETALSALRKNSKDRPKYESAIESKKGLLDLRNQQLAHREQLVPVAEEIYQLSEEIAKLCDKRRALTPTGFANAEVPLLAAMRNGF